MRKLRITIGIVARAAAVLVPTAGSVVTGTRAETKPGLGILGASVLAPITGGAALGGAVRRCQWDMVRSTRDRRLARRATGPASGSA